MYIIETVVTAPDGATELFIHPARTDEYAAEIKREIAIIEAHEPDDYNIVSNYLIYKNRYEEALDGNYGTSEPIRTYYIRKEAYRHIANKRGYADEVIHKY